ncbi:MAG: prolipoprotein diacylglyceryl transferase [Cyanobacteria bacterium]|nr:prolipoprotein diacylglyceryl transferase [Cyanobacteria bacterium CG_2015-16_32_12]NCO77146.1 prolipoprotein diacylglyceryl transferase [Cyanobacteria bacterium CG_2015-22_32_23]NCQ05315.1 prolipoprotein diacylglyceryl transferase [Cyanobacteria bacterium CG_2015-09_32_10]NCQ42503.1 prolipoprotein diacylglyceryl transferase [Cyanobacteria bacterium CG_2015-04_32_10]NCS85400.1 prolipoprotein diacylglyceryl transferase [Cyanobacteria bacterium CG_2015-02_32_10]
MNFFIFTFQSPSPILFEIGPISLRWYGFLIASAVLIGVFLSQKLGKYRNIDPELISDLVIWLVIGAIPAARIYYVLFEWQNYAQHPQDIIAIWQGGIAIHGAIIGGVISALIFAKINRQSFWQLTDVIAPSLILGQAIGRWGNFFNSEAFGIPTNLPWKLYIPVNNRPIQYLNFEYFHPTFLYESLWNIGVFTLLIILFFWSIKNNNKLKTGTISLIYLIAYSLGRVWIEGFRIDSLMLGFLRIAQIVSLSAIAFGIFGLIWLYVLKKSLPDIKN